MARSWLPPLAHGGRRHVVTAWPESLMNADNPAGDEQQHGSAAGRRERMNPHSLKGGDGGSAFTSRANMPAANGRGRPALGGPLL